MGRIESKIEKRISRFLKNKGYWPIKISLCSVNGFPDRMVIGYKILFFIEVKSPGEKPGKLQEYIHGKIRKYGFVVIVTDCVEDVKDYVSQLKTRTDEKII
jgi:hypothetical protein